VSSILAQPDKRHPICTAVAIVLGITLVLTLLAHLTRPAAADELGTVIVEAQDENFQLIGGACYEINNGTELVGPRCDSAQFDGDPREGWVAFVELAPGDWVISEVLVSDGYQIAGDAVQDVHLAAGEIVGVVFTHTAVEPPVEPTPDFDAVVDPPPLPSDPPISTADVPTPVPPFCAGREATIVAATSEKSLPTKIFGTNGDDVIVGTAGPDVIQSGGGHDRICALGGNDSVQAGAGNDRAEGGDGADTLAGEAGADHLDGGAGKGDSCDGGGTGLLRERDQAVNCESMVGIP
jgi:hypothetical protein